MAGLLVWARRRRAVALFSLVLLAGCTAVRAEGRVENGSRVRLSPLPIEEIARGLRLAADVALSGAWRLASEDRRFGGFSGLAVENGRLWLLSDRGGLWSATLAPHGSVPVVEGSWRVFELRLGGRAPDAEDLARTNDGTLWVAIEGRHAIAPLPAEPEGPIVDLEPHPLPQPIAGLPGNGGVEALAGLGDGSLLAIGESELEGLRPALAMGPNGSRRLAYRSGAGFAPSAASWIADRLLVLERRVSPLSGFAARVVAVPARGASDLPEILAPEIELARWDGSWAIDNLEGLAAEPVEEDGSVRLWLVSDDNFSRWQRTLLVLLTWRPQPAVVRASSRRLSGTSSGGSSFSDTLRR
ncbi:MAG: esterase-like activity of phytase family protein [Geminicoccaceae bacterium]|nr:esterase-like activity of phytase family protein [Geminicoccaceae bacterium]